MKEIECKVIDSMTGCLGKAHISWINDNACTIQRLLITISRPWFAAIRTEAGEPAMLREIRKTIIHELAHIATRYIYGPRTQPHGIEWGRLMAKCGLQPYARHWYDIHTKVPGTAVTWNDVVGTMRNGR